MSKKRKPSGPRKKPKPAPRVYAAHFVEPPSPLTLSPRVPDLTAADAPPLKSKKKKGP